MSETWIYMLVDKAFFISNGVEYAGELGQNDIKICNSYNSAFQHLIHRDELYKTLGYKPTNSGISHDGDDLLFWRRLETEDGYVHVFEIHRKIVRGDLFQLHHS